MTAAQALEQVIRTQINNQSNLIEFGEVSAVDKTARTCTVSREGSSTLQNVRLNSVIDDYENHVTVFPAVGSVVSVIDLGLDAYAVLRVSAVESVAIKVGASEINVTDRKVEVLSGDDGVRSILKDLITEISKIIVVQGTSPNVVALKAISDRIEQIL